MKTKRALGVILTTVALDVSSEDEVATAVDAAVAELGENASSRIEDSLPGFGRSLLFRLLAGAKPVRWCHGHLRAESE